MTNADKFKQIFGLYATELWSKTEGEFLAWLNSDFSQSDVPDTNVGDMISRQDAIDAVSRGCQEFRGIFARCEKNLNELPSAKPQRKKGKWIDKSGDIEGAWNYCSVCGEQAIDLYDFCPNCGSYNGGEEDEN